MPAQQGALEWRATNGFTDRSGGDRDRLDFSKTFVYGSHHWRPPSPPRDIHRQHLTRIKNEMEFDLIKYRMSWSWMHHEPDRFVFDEVHELFNLCDKLDLST
jgi:hypothetical protein